MIDTGVVAVIRASASAELMSVIEALKKGGNLACALNASNEIAVEAFLAGRISFLEISRINETVMQQTDFQKIPSLDDYIATDCDARSRAKMLVDFF